MEVRFYNGRRLVYKVFTNGINGAIDLINTKNLEWTRYKIW